MYVHEELDFPFGSPTAKSHINIYLDMKAKLKILLVTLKIFRAILSM